MSHASRPGRLSPRGFTLIELLIVVAIIAILAAIAVPNFLEAQVRSKVSRAKADMRSVATALEAYAVDNQKYPFNPHNTQDVNGYGQIRDYGFLTVPRGITTPIAYMSSMPADVFKTGARSLQGLSAGRFYQTSDPQDMTFIYLAMRQAGPEGTSGGPPDPTSNDDVGAEFGFFSSFTGWTTAYESWGEWRLSSVGPSKLYPGDPGYPGASFSSINAVYDATNGTVSLGFVNRNQRDSEGKNK